MVTVPLLVPSIAILSTEVILDKNVVDLSTEKLFDVN